MSERPHHIFCNLRTGPSNSCRQCRVLYEKWPPREDETMRQMVERVFPDVIVR